MAFLDDYVTSPKAFLRAKIKHPVLRGDRYILFHHYGIKGLGDLHPGGEGFSKRADGALMGLSYDGRGF